MSTVQALEVDDKKEAEIINNSIKSAFLRLTHSNQTKVSEKEADTTGEQNAEVEMTTEQKKSPANETAEG